MPNLNKVLLMGNLTRDPELRTLPSGMAVCNFGMAINRNFTDREGNRREETTFVDVESFGKQAETISRYMVKGRAIFVEGRLKLDQWESNAGEKRSKMRVALENFQFVGGRGDDDNHASSDRSLTTKTSPIQENDRSTNTETAKENAASDNSAPIEEDDVPF
ncbi:MAG: single-stranded DNA-binding protein [Opitutae bacterium]|nr:single-stranded DNA-binding protein [Opitutae bacterium]|tara:strand:+ start:1015 stop:1500 length:486 start_codon:yes stop_codon:yes gene_type:complete